MEMIIVISLPLFKQVWLSNLKVLILVTLALCVFITVMCNVFTPTTLNSLQSAEGSLIGNIVGGVDSLVGFIGNSFFAIMAIIFPMLYSIFVGNKLMAEKVEQGTMAGLLATPTKRITIVLTSALFFILSIILMWLVVFIVGVVAANTFQPDALNVDAFARLCIGCFLYHFVISSICFCTSTIFNTTQASLGIGGGISLFFFLVNLIMKLSNELDYLKYLTLNTLFDTTSLISGEGYVENLIILLLMGIVLYAISIVIFPRKDLPL